MYIGFSPRSCERGNNICCRIILPTEQMSSLFQIRSLDYSRRNISLNKWVLHILSGNLVPSLGRDAQIYADKAPQYFIYLAGFNCPNCTCVFFPSLGGTGFLKQQLTGKGICEAWGEQDPRLGLWFWATWLKTWIPDFYPVVLECDLAMCCFV